jgi:hypothetical protein
MALGVWAEQPTKDDPIGPSDTHDLWYARAAHNLNINTRSSSPNTASITSGMPGLTGPSSVAAQLRHPGWLGCHRGKQKLAWRRWRGWDTRDFED